jgi:hypothetical protein
MCEVLFGEGISLWLASAQESQTCTHVHSSCCSLLLVTGTWFLVLSGFIAAASDLKIDLASSRESSAHPMFGFHVSTTNNRS